MWKDLALSQLLGPDLSAGFPATGFQISAPSMSTRNFTPNLACSLQAFLF